MKQLPITVNDDAQLREFLSTCSGLKEAKSFYFHIFTSLFDDERLEKLVRVLDDCYPGCSWLATSTAGNIVNAETADEIVLMANLFEYESTHFEIFQYEFDGREMEQIADEMKRELSMRPWTKGIEFYHSIPIDSTTYLCDALADIEPSIQIFGGIVCSPDISSTRSFIASSAGSMSGQGLICIFYGGEDLTIDSIKISGWKPIGRTFKVTKARGNILKELSGIPAYEVYNKYLDIRNDQYFFINAIDFPIMYEHNNTTIVRACGSSNADGSLKMSSNIETGSVVRLSYGDPKTILESVREHGIEIRKFQPDTMHIFSCAARATFWTGHDATFELEPLRSISDSYGFFSHGEFFREKGLLNQHNLTLVIASFREGGVKPADEIETIEDTKGKDHRISIKVPLSARLATFVGQTSYELEDINSRLEALNQQLLQEAKQDALTGLGNRQAFNDMLDMILLNRTYDYNWTMYVLDVNGLKDVNDTFGHLAGDELLKASGRILENVFGKQGYCYRLGGDEFAVLLHLPMEETDVFDVALQKALKDYKHADIFHLSLALGKSSLMNDHGWFRSLPDWKMDADLNMYRNKAAAKKVPEQKMNRNIIDGVSCLASIVEARDPYTAHHSDRVCEISELIARKMGLTENTIGTIHDAAKLHDVGKVGVPDEILLKPGALTADEFDKIKEHPVLGARILLKSNFPKEIVTIVLTHHERFDGKGYPQGIAGGVIPLGARIIALADSLDAMSSKRIYRDSLPLDVCYEEIQNNMGLMYDPVIANIVLKNWDEIVEILKK